MPLPNKGVENPRRAALADIVTNRNAALVSELEEGGASAEEIADLKTGAVADPGTDDPRRPADIAAEDWGKMSDEERGNAIKAAEAAAAEAGAAGETEEQKAERERLAAEAKAEEDRKAAGGAKIKGKVDGKEVEFDQSAVIEAGLRTLQKDAAADVRLEEATKAREEAKRLLEVAKQAAAAPAADAKKTEQEMIAAKENLRGIVKKIQYGSEDEAAEALVEYGNKMAAAGQSGRLTATELHNILDLREAQAFVKTNYADVVGDENLKELFVTKVNRKIAAGDVRPYQAICKETGDELRAWKAPAKSEPTLNKDGQRTEALERKTKVLSIPAASGRKVAAPTETKPPSNSDLVEQARKARGQA